MKTLALRIDGLANTVTASVQDKNRLLAWATPKSTSMRLRFTSVAFPTTKTMETSEQSIRRSYRTLTSLLEAFPARRFLSPEKGKGSKIQEVRSSLRSLELLGQSGHAFYFLRTSKGFYLTATEKRSTPSSPRLMNWGTTSNGRCLTARISESPRIGNECSLSDILEERPDRRYFLSKLTVRRLLGYKDQSLIPLRRDTKRPRQDRMLLKINLATMPAEKNSSGRHNENHPKKTLTFKNK